jgi:iron complex transport system permease protein
MDGFAVSAPRSAAARATAVRSTAVRASGLLGAVAALVVIAVAGIAVGSHPIPIGTVISALFDHSDVSREAVTVRDLRLPRTLLGLGVGAALGLAGALMQALTRNPLADPGILGVDRGAALGVVIAIVGFGITDVRGYVWFAFVGAAVVSVTVYMLGATGRSGATPVRLALAGTAIGAALGSVTWAVRLFDREAFDQLRFWTVGALAGRDLSVLVRVAPFLLAGALLALSLGRPLNAIALSDETARALGAHLGRTRALGALAVTLLCGAATAAIGPIGFVGLVVPHIARSITGPDQGWVLAYSLLLGPILLVGADIVGRVVVPPGELAAGIVTAFIGAPFFVAVVRRRRIPQL